MSLREIGQIFIMDYTAVSQAVRKFEEKMKKDKKLKKMVEYVLNELKAEKLNVNT